MAPQTLQLADRLMREHVLDLNLHAFRHQVGDLLVYGSWVGTEEIEPALVILPANRRAKPCIIGLSAAWKYDDPRYLAHSARAFAQILGLDDNMSSVAKLADLIHGRLGDLLAMPPMPVREKVIGEGVIDDGTRAQTFEMLQHEPDA